MTIDKFITQYKVSNDKDEFLKKRIVEKYVPYAEKIAYCQNIVKNSSYVNVDDENQIYQQNSPVRFVLFSMQMINLYTDIDVDFKNVLKQFDALNEVNAINCLISIIPESEYGEFNVVLQMVTDDFMENERSFIGYVDTKVKSLEIMFKSLTDMLTEDNIKKLIASVQVPTED